MDPFFERQEKKENEYRAANPDKLSPCIYCFQMVKNKDGKIKYNYNEDRSSFIMEWRCNECYDK